MVYNSKSLAEISINIFDINAITHCMLYIMFDLYLEMCLHIVCHQKYIGTYNLVFLDVSLLKNIQNVLLTQFICCTFDHWSFSAYIVLLATLYHLHEPFRQSDQRQTKQQSYHTATRCKQQSNCAIANILFKS